MPEINDVVIKTEPVEESAAAPPPDVIAAADSVMGNEEPQRSDDSSVQDGQSDAMAKIPYRMIFKRRKTGDRLRIKRQREMRQLQKHLTPKSALMSLNELRNQGLTVGDFSVDTTHQLNFVASITVNGKTYQGHGTSKSAARNAAAENALREYMLEMMGKMMLAKRTPAAAPAPAANKANGNDNGNANTDEDEPMEVESEPQFPILNLASFAVYKLFTQWQDEGYKVPDMIGLPKSANAENEGSVEPKPAAVGPRRTQLPDKPLDFHPTSLLLMMRQDTDFIYETIGQPPNAVHKTYITLDGRTFVGVSRNKRMSRRLAAASACNGLFNTEFPEEEEL